MPRKRNSWFIGIVMYNALAEIAIVFVLIVLVVTVFIHISRRLRRGGGSLTTTMLGATDLFYHKDKMAAVKQIVEMKAGKKQEEQGTEEPQE